MCNGFLDYVEDVNKRLAEKDKRIKDLEFRNKNLEHSLKVAPNANAGQRARIVELKEINHKLKQQLADKEKAIENYEKFTSVPLVEMTKMYEQEKIDYAVEKLERVKEKLRQNITITAPADELKKLSEYLIGIDGYIDQLITEMKGGE